MPSVTSPPVRTIIKSGRVVTGIETKLALGLIVFAATVPIVTIAWWGRPVTLTDFLTLIFVGIYMFAVITTFAIILLVGLGRLDLPEKFMYWLGVATIGEDAGLLMFVIKKVFAG